MLSSPVYRLLPAAPGRGACLFPLSSSKHPVTPRKGGELASAPCLEFPGTHKRGKILKLYLNARLLVTRTMVHPAMDHVTGFREKSSGQGPVHSRQPLCLKEHVNIHTWPWNGCAGNPPWQWPLGKPWDSKARTMVGERLSFFFLI